MSAMLLQRWRPFDRLTPERAAAMAPLLESRHYQLGQTVGSYTMNSPEHNGRGQNILFTDGSVEFIGSPVLMLPASAIMPPHSENIWLPMDAQQLEDGLDAPVDWTGIDIFLMQ